MLLCPNKFAYLMFESLIKDYWSHRQTCRNNSSIMNSKYCIFIFYKSSTFRICQRSQRAVKKQLNTQHFCPGILTTVMLKAYSRSKGRAATRSTKNHVVA